MQEYFAAAESDELVGHALGFITRWQSTIGTSQEGMAAVWWRNLMFYYSNLFYGTGTDSALDYVGAQGELIKMIVPQARSLNTQFLSLTTKQKLAFESEATSSDAATMADTRVANALTKQIIRNEHVDQQGYKMAEQASVLGLSYMKPCWNMMRGKPRAQDPETGEMIYSGDLEISVLSAFDVIFDTTKEDFFKQDYAICRVVQNRWDLAAKYPNMAEEIKSLPPVSKVTEYDMMWMQHFTEDSVFVYEFYHRSTPALPQGRMTLFSDKNTIYFDNQNPYMNPEGEAYVPLVQMKPEPIAGTGFGYPAFSNILPLQEMLDHGFSACATNQAAFAVQSVLNPIGNDISVTDLGGMKFVNYKPMADSSGGKPEALNLVRTSPETFKFVEMIRSNMMEIYNIPGALRGSPPPGVTAASAIATLTTNALEFAQNFSKSYFEALELVMTYSIWQYAQFADEEMIVHITGPNKKTIAKAFIGDDLKNVFRVVCKVANPLMATSAGKFEVANELMKSGKLKDVNQYFRLLEGAPLDALYEVDYNQEALIEVENDALRESRQVEALLTDNHPQHILNHLSLLDDPEIRMNGAMTHGVFAHVMQHRQLAEQLSMDPLLLQMLQTGIIPPMAAGAPNMPLPPGVNGPGAGPAKPAESLVPEVAQPMSLAGETPPVGG